MLTMVCAVGANAITDSQLKTRVEAATKNLVDLSVLGTVVESSKEALSKIEPNYARLYEFKSARIMLRLPDKMRMEGKLGMVKFEYIVNGGTKIFRASPIRINKKDDYSNDPAKLQSPLDVGLVTPILWEKRSVEVLNDAEARANREIKVQLRWSKGDMVYFAWIDEQNLWLKKFEKWDSQGNLKVRMIYSNPKNIGGIAWLPTRVDMYAPDGDKAGATELSDIKYNSGLADSLFQ
jgi:outer membrane lipoprotein-sorting protein